MKINEKDKKLFETLAQGSLGRDLADYLDRLCDFVCDSRSWGEKDTRESSNRAAEVIKEQLRGRITKKKDNGKVVPQFE